MSAEASLVSPHERSLFRLSGRASPERAAVGVTGLRSVRRRGLRLVERRQDLGGVAVGLDLRPDPGDPAVGIDEEGRAGDRPVLLAVVLLLDPRAVRLGDLVVLVGEEGERAGRTSRGTRACSRAPCGTDAPDVGASLDDRVVGVAELARLDGAAGRVVLGVEVEDRPAAALVGEPVDAPVSSSGGRPRGPGRRPRACSSRERSRGLHDEEPRRSSSGHRRVLAVPDVRQAAGRPARTSVSSPQRVAEAVGRHARRRPRRTGGARRGRRSRPSSASVAGPRSSRTRDCRGRGAGPGGRRGAGWASSADVGERVVEPRPAERAEDHDVGRRPRRWRPGARAPCRSRPSRPATSSTGMPAARSSLERRRRRANRRRRPSDRSGRRVRPRGARRRRRRRRASRPVGPARPRGVELGRGSARRRRRGSPPGGRPAGRSGRWRCRSRRRPARREARDEPLDPRRDRSERPRRRRPPAARPGRRRPRRSRSPGRRPPGPSACRRARRRRRRDLVGRVGRGPAARARAGAAPGRACGPAGRRRRRGPASSAAEPGPRELRLDDRPGRRRSRSRAAQPARARRGERLGHAREREDVRRRRGERRVPELVRLVEPVAAARRGCGTSARQSGT